MIIALKLPTVPQNGLTDELNLVSVASLSRIPHERFQGKSIIHVLSTKSLYINVRNVLHDRIIDVFIDTTYLYQ
jgi:hypothetical protein